MGVAVGVKASFQENVKQLIKGNLCFHQGKQFFT